METSMVERYRRWFAYEKEMHEKVLTSLNGVDTKLHQSLSFQKAIDLLAHILAARRMWLFRFGVLHTEPPDLFPEKQPFQVSPGNYTKCRKPGLHILSAWMIRSCHACSSIRVTTAAVFATPSKTS